MTLVPIYNFTLAGGDSLSRDCSFFIPGTAPAGNYICYGKIGTYPDDIIDSDLFIFDKAVNDDPFGTNRFENDDDDIYDFQLADHVTYFSLNPNPFNPTTTISFELRDAGFVSLRIFDVQGRQVGCLNDRHLLAGKHEFTFDGSGLPSGIYFAYFEAGDFQQTVKLLLMK